MRAAPHPILVVLVVLVAACLLPAVLPAQSCDEVRFRLWQKDADSAWFEFGEAVEIAAGESGHLYVHVSGASQGRSSHYSTGAAIGYPGHVGLEKAAVRPGEVAKHLKIKPQNASDRSAGRLRLEALAPGEARLGYRIDSVTPPGRIGMVSTSCRTGTVTFRVTDDEADDGHSPPANGDGEAESRAAAADELTTEIMSALLRRDVEEAEDAFTEEILRYGRDGILFVAGQIVASREFSTTALRRTDEAREGRARLDELRQYLLEDIYRDLYGYWQPTRDEREADLRDLEDCLRDRQESCERLGRELIARRAFYEHHRDLLDQL